MFIWRPRYFWRRRWFGPRFGCGGFGCALIGLLLFVCVFGMLFLSLLSRRF